MTLSPAQHTVCAELTSRAIGLNCHEEAAMVLEALATLIAQGERGSDVLKWLSLLPRARGRQALTVQRVQLRLVPAVSELPVAVQNALKPVTGQDRIRSVDVLLDPDVAYQRRVGRHGSEGRSRAARIVECADPGCSEKFQVGGPGVTGRPPTRCMEHRRPRPQLESA